MNPEAVCAYFPSLIALECDESVMKQFSRIKNNLERVDFCRNFFWKHLKTIQTAASPVKSEDSCRKWKFDGDKAYLSGNFMKALECYNRALCSSKGDPDNLAEAYEGRAFVFNDLRLDDECWENLMKAMKLNPEKEKSLFELREQCRFRLIDKTKVQSDHKDRLQLSYKSHNTIPFISECVAPAYNKQYGRHLFAKRSLKPGDVIMMETPFSCVLTGSGCYTKCANCLISANLNLEPCKKSIFTMFCSEDCRREAERKFHCYEAPIKSEIHSWFSDEMKIAIRNTIKAFTTFDSLNEMHDKIMDSQNDYFDAFAYDFRKISDKERFEIVYSHSTNQHLRNVEEMFSFSLTVGIAYELIVQRTELVNRLQRSEDHDLLKHLLFHFLEIATINSFSMAATPEIVHRSRSERETEFGIASYPLSAWLNHSCAPNVTKTNAGPNHETMLVVVTRPIKSGEQIFDSYFSDVNHYYASRGERRKILSQQYGFDCNCEACLKNFPTHDDLEQAFGSLNVMNLVCENGDLMAYNLAMVRQKYYQYCAFLKSADRVYPSKEIYVVFKNLLRCIWLLFKRPQIVYHLDSKNGALGKGKF